MRRALALAGQELHAAWANLLFNSIPAAMIIPRPLRALIYRCLGMRIRSWRIGAGCFFGGADVQIGEKTFINVGCFFDASAPIAIGANCLLGPRVTIVTSSHHLDADRTLGRAPVTIEDGSWIGVGATLLPGVTVGAGCVIAAGAVVTQNCQPYGLYAGVPARRIRSLDIQGEAATEKGGRSASVAVLRTRV